MALKLIRRARFKLLLLLVVVAAFACYIDRLFDQERVRIATIREIENAGGSVVIDDAAGFALFSTENVVAIETSLPFDQENPTSDFDVIDRIKDATQLRQFTRLSKLTVGRFVTETASGSIPGGTVIIPRDAHKFLNR